MAWAPAVVGAFVAAGFALSQATPAQAQLREPTSGTSTRTKSEDANAIPTGGGGAVPSIPRDWVMLPPSAIVDLVAVGHRTCALNAAGDLWCWGIGAPDSPLPRKIGGAGGALRHLYGSGGQLCAVREDGKSACWPAVLATIPAAAFAGGPPPPFRRASNCVLALDATGNALVANAMTNNQPLLWKVWSLMPYGVRAVKPEAAWVQYPDPRTGTRMAEAFCGIASDGVMWCTEVKSDCTAGGASQAIRAPDGNGLLRNVVAAAGNLVRTGDNKLYAIGMNHTAMPYFNNVTDAWGHARGGTGFLALGSEVPPNAVLWVGGQQTMGLTGNGTVYTAADKPGNQRVLLPDPEQGVMAGVRKIVVGEAHACALTGRGTVACWGRNDAGQLGRGFADTAPHARPAYVYWPPTP